MRLITPMTDMSTPSRTEYAVWEYDTAKERFPGANIEDLRARYAVKKFIGRFSSLAAAKKAVGCPLFADYKSA